MVEANIDHVPGYGSDPWTEKAVSLFRQHFGSNVEVALTYNGTGANIVALGLATKSFNAVICPKTAHINVDECGAPEVFTGCKLITVESSDGKLTVDQIAGCLRGKDDQHQVQPKLVSISQMNEAGVVYSCEEIRRITEFCHKNDMLVHMDGSRLSNAAAGLGISLKEGSGDLGIDVLSYGGTKNGIMGGEAVVVFNPDLFENIKFVRKQATQLASKMRFISAQFIALLSNDLWLRNASHANRMAALLADKVRELGIVVAREVRGNAVFAVLSKVQIERLQRDYYFYVWNEGTGEVRWMTSFDTTEEDVLGFVRAIEAVV